MAAILIAEDDNDMRLMLGRALSEAGYDVETFEEGTSIVNGKAELPDLFILDHQIPTIDGLALSKYLKINDDTRDIPIIIISAYPQVQKKAEQIGVNEFLQKPFELKALLQMVEKHVSH